MNDSVRATLQQIRLVQRAVSTETALKTSLGYVLETTSLEAIDDLRARLSTVLDVTFDVSPMFPDEHDSGKAEDQELAHFYELEIHGLEHRDLDESPFELGYYLRDMLDLRSIEPDLETDFANVIEPDDEADRESALLGGCWVDDDAPEDTKWALKNMRIDKAWNLKLPKGGKPRGRDVLIGHIDTGVNKHDELEGSALDMRPGANFIEGGESLPIDPLTKSGLFQKFQNPGHGISTGSVIVSRQDNKITGSATQATLLPVRAIRSVVRVTQGSVAKGINYARKQGAQVITMSLGGLKSKSLKKAIKRAVKDNILVMAAAGNCVGIVVHPAALKQCIAIAGTNERDLPWKGSSFGRAVDVSAPAELVWRAKRQKPSAGTDKIEGGQGTSFAVALTAGVAALWLAYHGRDKLIATLKPGEKLQDRFRGLLRDTARRPDHGQWDPSNYGTGIVDAEALLRADPMGTPMTESAIIAAVQADADETDAEDVPELVARTTGHDLDDLGLNLAERQRYGLEIAWLAYNKAQERLRPGTSTETAVIKPKVSPSLHAASASSVSAPLRSLLGEVRKPARPVTSAPVDPQTSPSGDDGGGSVSMPVQPSDNGELVSVSNLAAAPTEHAPVSSGLFQEPVVHRGSQGSEPGETDVPTPKSTEKMLGFGYRTESILGEDDRQRVRETTGVPWRRICALRIRSSAGDAVGTAWFVGPRTLITAGHCVFHRDMNGWAREIVVTPGLDGTEPPEFGVHTVQRFSTLRRWVDHHDPDFDIGAIHLDEPLGDRVGWFGAASLPDHELRNHLINVSGYPWDEGRGTHLLHHQNRVLDLDQRRIHYDVDTNGGQSGSPAYIYRTGEDLPTVVGVHAYGDHPGGIEANSAPRLTPSMIRLIQQWVEADNGQF